MSTELGSRLRKMICSLAFDAIFIVRQMQQQFRVKGKKLYFSFVDLETLLIEFQEKY